MPYVEGESLYDGCSGSDSFLQRRRYASRSRWRARWLANEQGVVHRDIKPDNNLLSGDGVLVADFGVARAVSEMQSKLTATGMIVGTPTYMSPEQAASEPNLDGRSDIFALACVLYEMLAGEPPFKGPTPQMTLMLRLMQPARPLRPMVRVTEDVEAALLRALAKDGGALGDGRRFRRCAGGEHSHASTTAPPRPHLDRHRWSSRQHRRRRRCTHRRRATRLPPRVLQATLEAMASERNPFVLRLHVRSSPRSCSPPPLVAAAVLLWLVPGSGSGRSSPEAAPQFFLAAGNGRAAGVVCSTACSSRPERRGATWRARGSAMLRLRRGQPPSPRAAGRCSRPRSRRW